MRETFSNLPLGYFFSREDSAFSHLLCSRDSELPPSPSGCDVYCHLQIEGLAILYSAREQYCSVLLTCPQLSRAQMATASEVDLKATQAVAVQYISYVFIYVLMIVMSGNTCTSCQILWYPVAILSFHQQFADSCQVVSLLL